MGTNTAAMREFASTLPAWDRMRVLSAADELDKMRTALAMEPHVSEQLDAERAAHEATRRVLAIEEARTADLRARLESAEGALRRCSKGMQRWVRNNDAEMIGEVIGDVNDHFARFGPGGGT